VEAPQGVELTDPNRSIELAPLQERAKTMLEHKARPDNPARTTTTRRTIRCTGRPHPGILTGWPKIKDHQAFRSALTGRPGDHSQGDPPDPIPNSAVKPLCAHGTAGPPVGE
jgi:hypothetical protein